MRRRASEVDEEARVELHAAVRVAVHAQQPGAQPGIELVVPGRVQRVGDVEPAPVERELEHLRAAVEVAAGVERPAEHAAELQLPGEPRVRRVGDVVLAQVAVQPVREVQEAVVHRDDEVGDQPGDRERPALLLDALDGDHLVGAVGAVVAVEVPHRARQRGADEALVGVGVVQPADLERHEPGLAQLERLLDAALAQVPEVQAAAVVPGGDVRRGRTRPRRPLGSPNSDEASTFWRGWYQKS